jgi:G:T-mismatch repair DNA endonuclease (very short patch repair protein)
MVPDDDLAHRLGKAKRHLGYYQKLGWMRYIRESRKQQALGRPARGYNHLEAKLAELLDARGIAYQWQYRLGRYVYDFCLPGRILIEVHGGYWHGDPRLYDRLTPTQRRNRLRDDAKAAYAQARGYTLRVVWEQDLVRGTVSGLKPLSQSG